MAKNKSKLVEKIVKAGITGGLCLLPVLSNGQSNSMIQKGVNAGNYKGETQTHIIYHFGFNSDLKNAIKSAGKPHLSTTDKNSYLIFNKDSSGYDLYYPKANFNKSGKGKTIALTIQDGNKIGPCDSTGLGSKYSPLPSFFFTPTNGQLEQKKDTVIKEVIKEVPNKEPANIYNIEINTTNITNTTNNYAPIDTSHNKPKCNSLEFRALIEATKSLNDNFSGISVNPQIGRGLIWVGPYAKYNFGNKSNSFSEDVYKKILLNQTIQLFTETEGVRKGSSKLIRPFEFGGVLSLGTKDGRLRFDLSYGGINEVLSTSDVNESGFDRKLQGNKIIEEKPYSVNINKGKKYENWNQIQKAGVAVQPFKKSQFYLGVEGQHIGKLSSKQGVNNFNVKAGWKIGGRKK